MYPRISKPKRQEPALIYNLRSVEIEIQADFAAVVCSSFSLSRGLGLQASCSCGTCGVSASVAISSYLRAFPDKLGCSRHINVVSTPDASW